MVDASFYMRRMLQSSAKEREGKLEIQHMVYNSLSMIHKSQTMWQVTFTMFCTMCYIC